MDRQEFTKQFAIVCREEVFTDVAFMPTKTDPYGFDLIGIDGDVNAGVIYDYEIRRNDAGNTLIGIINTNDWDSFTDEIPNAKVVADVIALVEKYDDRKNAQVDYAYRIARIAGYGAGAPARQEHIKEEFLELLTHEQQFATIMELELGSVWTDLDDVHKHDVYCQYREDDMQPLLDSDLTEIAEQALNAVALRECSDPQEVSRMAAYSVYGAEIYGALISRHPELAAASAIEYLDWKFKNTGEPGWHKFESDGYKDSLANAVDDVLRVYGVCEDKPLTLADKAVEATKSSAQREGKGQGINAPEKAR